MVSKSKKPVSSGASTSGGNYKDRVADPATIAADASAHHPNQPYQSTAQSRLPQQSRQISNIHPEHQTYVVQNGYHPQGGSSSPYLNGPPIQHQTSGISPTDAGYYASHPSPRSTHSASGQYYASDKVDSMAATAHMQRPYPPIYHTPQSNSPASVASPQSHDHGRPMYAQPAPPLAQPMYAYPQYQPMTQVHQSAYGGHPSQSHQQHQIAPQPMMPYQSSQSQMPHPQALPHPGGVSSSPRLKMDTSQHHQATSQNRTPMLPQQHMPSAPQAPQTPTVQTAQTPTSATNSSAAPGPIPATTPLVVKQDGNGVQWIAFEYSRDRVKMEYTIRCDVESVNVENLSSEFKAENCVYPRACVSKDLYKGNRLGYETECNTVGWALADLNPCLRSKRGLIQRAVDSWRNSNQDPRLRSRRVRRQAKMTNRQKVNTQSPSHPPGSGGPTSAGLPSSNTSMAAPSTRPPGSMPAVPQQIHHHHAHPDGSGSGQDVGNDSGYNNGPHVHRQSSVNQHMTSPNEIRQGHVFAGYQNYPTIPTTLGPSMAPSMQGGMHQLGRPGGNAAMASREKEEEDSALMGAVPEGKRRKFILVDDTQRSCRVRVKVQLD